MQPLEHFIVSPLEAVPSGDACRAEAEENFSDTQLGSTGSPSRELLETEEEMRARVCREVREQFGPTLAQIYGPEEMECRANYAAMLAASNEMLLHAEASERGISVAEVEAENAEAGREAEEQIQRWRLNDARRKKRARSARK